MLKPQEELIAIRQIAWFLKHLCHSEEAEYHIKIIIQASAAVVTFEYEMV